MSHHPHGHQKHHGPYWRRAHRDWRFYVGAVLVLVALASYSLNYHFLSLDLRQAQHQAAGDVGRQGEPK